VDIPKPYYEQDGITIYHGDCRDVLPTLELGSVDLVLTDPPYGISYATNFAVRGIGASWLNTEIANDADTTVRDAMLQLLPGIPALVFGTWKVQRPRNTRAVLVWDKGPASGMGDLSFPWKGSWEEIYVIGGGFSGHRDEGVIKGFTELTWESQGRSHPNQKPVKLLRYLLSKHPGQTILDPFMGSGTTLRAAKDLGRRAIGIEIEERYCEIAAKRLQQAVLPLGMAAD
jgi:DNA modification methylase